MRTKYIFASCLLSALAFTGCQEIDTFPEGNTITSDQKDQIAELDPTKVEAGINAIFSQFSQYMANKGAMGAERHNDIGYPTIMLATDANGYDVISDTNGYNWTGFSITFEDRIYTSNECQMVWNNVYGIIYASNNVIAFIPEETDMTSLNKKFLGQAKAARAFGYFTLAQLYQFNYIGHQSAPCVPLITDKNSEEATLNGMPRATVEEVYKQILTDLDSATDLLNAAEAEGEGRADRRYINASVTYGLKARVYLTMQNWKEAVAAASKALEI